MAQNSGQLIEDLEQVVNFCRHIANSHPITGMCICGDHALDLFNAKTPLEILLIVDDFQPRIMNYIKFFGNTAVIIYTVDKWVFERDIDRGFLGEALAVQLIFPYVPLTGKDYLKAEEFKLKKRLIVEILENLVLNFPELSYEIHIKPEYFMYEAMLTRARLFPLTSRMLLNFLHRGAKEKNVKIVMDGYAHALKALERENIVEHVNGYVKVPKEFADAVKRRKTRFINLLKSAQKTLFMSLLGTFPKIFGALLQNRDMLLKFQFFESEKLENLCHIEDSKKYLFVPTAEGFTPLAARISVEKFARKILSASTDAEIMIEELGGVLNDVYVVKVLTNSEERKAVIKTFKNWSSFMWFPLTLWAFGTRTFTFLGRSRLEKECAMNQFLYRKGFSVPKLLAINHNERLVFMEYIEGESLEKIIKRIVNLKDVEKVSEGLKILQKVGGTFARVHALDVTLGDTKPENILIGKNGEIYLLDFEQSSRDGNKAWDIAEFLYYAGHYVPPIVGTRPAELVTKAFLKGYLDAGGELKTIKDAGKPKYIKVFSVFVFPHIIFAISNICKKAEQLGD